MSGYLVASFYVHFRKSFFHLLAVSWYSTS